MDEHEDLEHWLRQGLRPRQAPAGFSARLMARLPETSPVRSFQNKRTFRVPAIRWATAVVLLGLPAAATGSTNSRSASPASAHAHNSSSRYA